MARLIMEWIPEDREIYSARKAEIEMSDEATLDDMFEAWTEQMALLGYHVEDYFLQKDTLT